MSNKVILYCTSCGSNLENQYGFYRNINVWVCTVCKHPQINPNYPNDIIWFCDRCNSILNNQDGWDPYYNGVYSCKDCGYINNVGNTLKIEGRNKRLLK